MPAPAPHFKHEFRIHQIFSGETLSIVVRGYTLTIKEDEAPNPTQIMLRAIEGNSIPGPGLYATVITTTHIGTTAQVSQTVNLSDVAPNPNPIQQEDADHA